MPSESKATNTITIMANSDMQHGLEFRCNQEASLVRCARLQFMLYLAMLSGIDTLQFVLSAQINCIPPGVQLL